MLAFLRKNWLLIVLALVATVVGFVWAYPRFGPKQPVPLLPGIVEKPASRFSEVAPKEIYTIRASPLVVPKQLAVFQVKQFSQSQLPAPATSLLATWGSPNLSPTQPIEGVLLWTDSMFSLLVDLPSGKFTLSEGKIQVAPSFSLTTAQGYAAQEVMRLGLAQKIGDIEARGLVVVGDHLEGAPNAADADIYVVNVSVVVDNLPLVSVGQSQNHIEFRLTRDGKINKLSYQINSPGEEIGNFPVVEWEGAIAQLQTGQAQTLYLKDLQGNPTTPLAYDTLRQATVNRAYLAYFDSGEDQTTLQPVFVFEGTGTTTTGEARTFALYISAIETK